MMKPPSFLRWKTLPQKERRALSLYLWLLLVAPLALAAATLAPRVPAFVESVYSRGIYAFFSQCVSTLNGWLPVSFTELLLFAALPLLAFQILRLVRKKTTWRRCLAGLLALASCLYGVFVFGWSLNYARQPYAETAGLDAGPAEASELEALCLDLAAQANALRAGLTDADAPLPSPYTQSEALRLVSAAYDQAGKTSPWLAGHYGNPKLAILSAFLAQRQIAGIFSPFTLEAHVDKYEYSLMIPATACHEAAHLRGFAREDEANFIAYQVCVASGDPYFAYSGTFLALIHAGNQLYATDAAAYNRLYAAYMPGLIADLKAYNANWKPFEGEKAEQQERVNDTYLKANGQTDGVRSYGRMVDLLIALRRAGRLYGDA